MENNPLDKIREEVEDMTPEEREAAATEMDAGSFGTDLAEDNAMATENAERDPERQGEPVPA